MSDSRATSASLVVGLSGTSRNASVTLCTPDRVLGGCAQERITRVRGAGVNPTGLPDEALDELLRRTGRRRTDVTTYASSDTRSPEGEFEAVRLDHHQAHACSAYLPSGFDSAVIVVCDHEPPYLSVWEGGDAGVRRIDWPEWRMGLAELYSQCADALGFGRAEQRMEALARLSATEDAGWATPLFSLRDDGPATANGWQDRIAARIAGGSLEERAGVAAALQRRIGELLVELLSAVRDRAPSSRRVCLGGSLFYNSHLNARVRCSGLFDDVFVPVDPGNAGLSLGAALHAARTRRQTVTPFLGPSYSPDDVKATFDNCKLTYRWVSESDTIPIAVDALRKGQLVAWFEGRMEFGPRALGGRSILANPFNRYVLENLNLFLKQRDSWRGYALSVPAAAVHQHFDGPDASPFMECDYSPKDRDLFRHALPARGAALRVQTVGTECPAQFRGLLRAFGEAAGCPALVNTSFNGFREPIVCSPRDAVRVFYGTGIDMMVFGQFILTK